MSLRRIAISLALLTAAAFGTGLAGPASANPPCDQVSQPCHTYDADKRTTAALLFATYAACAQNVPAGAVCTAVETVGGTAYWFVFFPYQACANVNNTNQCVGPIE